MYKVEYFNYNYYTKKWYKESYIYETIRGVMLWREYCNSEDSLIFHKVSLV